MHFIKFWCIGDRLVDLLNSVQNGPNWYKSSCHEVASEFFATNAPNPPHWTLNSCFCVFCKFGAFVTVWLSYETRCKTGRTRTKVRGTKSHRNFSKNERTRSIPSDPKLMFRCVSYNFGALGIVWLSYKSRCKTFVIVQKIVPRSRVGIFRNERTRSTPLDPKK